MTRELLTALGANAEGETRNAESAPIGLVPRPLPPEGEAIASPPGGGAEQSEAAGGEDALSNSEFQIPNSALPPAPSDSAWPAEPDPELAAIHRHFERLRAESEALGRELPDFDPALALRDPDFLRLTAPGVGMDPRRAWFALHPELLERRAADASAAALARSLASGAQRPREGGGRSGATVAADYRSLPRREQQRLKERILQAAALGEKIYP